MRLSVVGLIGDVVGLQRPPLSADQIAALPPFGSPEREVYVRTKGASFEPETLVYLLRESIERADTALFHHLGTLLIGEIDGSICKGGHCESIIMSVANHSVFRGDEDRRQDFRAMVHRAMWQAIYDGSEDKHFWEERFGYALKEKCLEIARTLGRKYRQQERDEIDDVSIQVALSDGGRQTSHGLGAIDEAALIYVIQALPERQAQAAFLRWVEGRPVAGGSTESVAAVMRISETAAHNLLAKARKSLAASPIVRELRGNT